MLEGDVLGEANSSSHTEGDKDFLREGDGGEGGEGVRMDSSSRSLVRVNVGGTWYTTTRTTLEAKPRSIFPKMLSDQVHTQTNKNNNKDGQGYYFIDRDGELFRYILNYLRSSQLNLPADFTQHQQLISEAKFYGLGMLEEKILKHAQMSGRGTGGNNVCQVEIVEIAHPEKIGVCSARVVLTEDLQESAPFCDVISSSGTDSESYQGLRGRTWVRTNISRLEWGEILRMHGWKFIGMTSYTRRIADITGHGTDLCHVVEKWENGGR